MTADLFAGKKTPQKEQATLDLLKNQVYRALQGKPDLLVKEKPHSLQTEEIALTEKTQRLPAVQVLPTVMTVQAHQIALIFQREKKTRVL